MLLFALGILTGFLLAIWTARRLQIGVLRVNSSDPDDGPYLFLELRKGMSDIFANRYVLLKVSLDGYLPRE